MIPGLQSIPESELHPLCGSNSDSRKNRNYNTFRVVMVLGLELIPAESDFRHAGSDSDSS